jgi:uncharacterized membrane protein
MEPAEGPRGRHGDPLAEWIEGVTTAIEIAGIAIVLIGVVIATVLYLRAGLSGRGWSAAYREYRANLGRGILLGLELLVAADIIGTVAVTPTFTSLGVLAGIVLIRTFLSVALEVEIEGRWPWQPRPRDTGAPPVAPADGGSG